MGKSRSVAKLLLAIACISASAVGVARQTGGGYTLSINGGTAFPISSIDFGGSSLVSNATGAASGRTQLSPVTVTASTATLQLYSLFSSCVSGQHLAKMTAVYANGQGQTQFTVNFETVLVTSYTFPTVDTASGPLGDITVVFTAAKEEYSTPAPPRQITNNRLGTGPVNNTIPITRVWHTSSQPAAPATKFAFTTPKLSTTGVNSILSFSAKPPGNTSSGSGAGKVSLTTFSITVNPVTGQDFIKSAQANTHISDATLVLNRPGANGANLPMTLVFHDVLFSGFNIGGDHPIVTITLTFASVQIQTGGTLTNYNIETKLKSF